MKTIYSIQDDIEYLHNRIHYLNLLLKVTHDTDKHNQVQHQLDECATELLAISTKS